MPVRWFAVSAALVAACGRFGYDSAALDASGIDAEVQDATPLGPFGTADLIGELSLPSVADDDPSPTGDLLEIYFESTRAGGPGSGDIWVATRSSPDVPWNPPVLVSELSSPASETGPEVASDGLTIFFASDRTGSLGRTDIWMSTRADRSSAWSPPLHVPELSSTEDDTAPAPRAGVLELVLESTRNGNADLFLTTRASTSSAWATPRPISEINTSDHEGSGYLTPDGRTLLFNARRLDSLGAADLYIATRADTDQPFANITRLDVSSSSNDEDPWLSGDGHTLFFASNRSGDVELYTATR